MKSRVRTRSSLARATLPLHRAVKLSHYEIVNSLLQNNVDVNVETNLGHTPIRIALMKKNIEMCRLLLKFQANVNIPDNKGVYPLDYAVENCSDEIVQLLLSNNADVDCVGGKDLTPLARAIISNRPKTLELLFNNGADNIDDKQFGRAMSHILISQKREIFKLILETNLDLNFVCKFEPTFFFLCWKNYHLKIDDCFLSFGIFPSIISMFKDFEQHLVKLKAANFIQEEFFSSVPFNPPGIQEKFCAEIAMMKSENVANSVVSFYDILRCSVTQLVAYLQNESLRTVIEEGVWKERYPNYQAMIYYKFAVANKRRKLLDQAKTFLQEILPPLPVVCEQKIINCFTIDELKSLVFDS